ncbi:MAG TPA: GNAT family N-acetyltransferase [Thermoplasmata archaeon]|nr:GNAT family N-acetyltransferase [Thermoplasmata archaeon]
MNAGLEMVDRLISGLPGAYGPPQGDVLLWFDHDDVVACGALRELGPKVGEIKRISVRSDYRGKEFGPVFVRALIDRARELGYARLRVDTLPTMQAAIEFYQESGFRPAPSFWPHPVAGALFFEFEVGTSAGRGTTKGRRTG